MPDPDPVARYRPDSGPAELPVHDEPAELVPSLDFPSLIRRLDALRTTVAEQEAEVAAEYQARLATARQAVARADAAVSAAQTQVAVAREQVRHTDAAATQVWRILATRLTPRAAGRLGPLPEPTPEPDPAVEQPMRLVAGARARLDVTRAVNTLAAWVYLLIAGLAGGAGAGVAALAAGVPVRAVRLALLVAGALLGLLPARLVARFQHAHLDAVGVVVAGLAGGLGTAAVALAG